jgi:hypothetical protein
MKHGTNNGSFYRNVINISYSSSSALSRIGVYIDGFSGTCSDIDVYDNIIFGNGTGISIAAEEVGGNVNNISIFNNIVKSDKEKPVGPIPNDKILAITSNMIKINQDLDFCTTLSSFSPTLHEQYLTNLQPHK